MKKKQSDYEPVCALCEYFRTIEMTGDTVCILKKSWRNVCPDSTCSRFELDLIALDPRPGRRVTIDIEPI